MFPKLIRKVHDYMKRANVRNALEPMWALMIALLLTITNALPAGRSRRAISSLVTILIILVIIVAGVAIILALLVLPGGPSTTTIIYP